MAAATKIDHAAGTSLQEWAIAHEPSDEMIFKSAYWGQIKFIRDVLSQLFYPGSYEEWEANPVHVVGEHTSKSIKMPVFSILVPGIVEVRLRYNCFNWVVSVKSEEPVNIDFLDLFDAEAKQELVYAEGFEARWVFPPFSVDDQEFSFSVGSDYILYTFCWMLTRQLGIGGNKPS